MDSAETKIDARDVRDFDRVELRYYGELHIRQGDEESLTVEADPSVLPRLKTEVRGGKLVLDLQGDWLDRLTAGLRSLTGKPVVYRLNVKELRAIEISGKGDVDMEELRTDSLKVASSGLGKLRIGRLEADTLQTRISGRADIGLAGRVREQSVAVSGSGDYRGAELDSAIARVKISGHGRVSVAASDSLNVAISGMGNVEYRGEPKLSQSISGMGKVTRLG